MTDETFVVIPNPDLVREFDTDDRGRLTLKMDKLKNSKIQVAAKIVEDTDEEENPT